MTNNRDDNFAEKLRRLRIAEGYTQQELAKRVNLSRSCIANYEAGKRTPAREIKEYISDFFQV